MTKEELLALGLTEDQIKDVFKINGTDIEKAKGDLTTKETELASVKEQLKTANTEIESFKSMDIDTIKAAAAEYKTKFEEAQANAQKEIESLKFDHELESAINTAKAKNVKAVKALLNIEALKNSKNQSEDIKAALEATKTDNDYLFGEITPAGTGGAMGGGAKPPASTEVKDLGSALKDFYK